MTSDRRRKKMSDIPQEVRDFFEANFESYNDFNKKVVSGFFTSPGGLRAGKVDPDLGIQVTELDRQAREYFDHKQMSKEEFRKGLAELVGWDPEKRKQKIQRSKAWSRKSRRKKKRKK